MLSMRNIRPLALGLALFAAVVAGLPVWAMAQNQQTPANTSAPDPASALRPRKIGQKPESTPAGEAMEPGDTARPTSNGPAETQPGSKVQLQDETAVANFYNNFFTSYRLGPEDVISVSVFSQDRYSRGAITIPPSGRISLALIPGGLFVNGKTTEEVEELIKKNMTNT